MIELKKIKKTFSNRELFTDVTLQVKKGETVVLFGPSGSGKTVLLKICLGLIKPDSGDVLIQGKNITQLSEKELTVVRLDTGMLFQYYALFDSMTVSENIGFYLANHSTLSKSEIMEKVSHDLKLVDMAGSEHLYPSELSGGMQKRVGIARALIHRPQIIFYDSPTDGLDPVTSDKIIDLIISLNQKMSTTSLVISNDMNTAFRLATKIGMVYNGKIHAFGSPLEIAHSKDPAVYQFIRGLENGPLLDH